MNTYIIRAAASFLFFYFVLFQGRLVAQTLQPPKILSPNMSSLDKFGEIPVNMFTGTPDISIPIHTVQYGSVNVPISLRYHPSSTRLTQHEGWVGFGWDLESIGSITRQNKSSYDELNLPVSPSTSYYPRTTGAINGADLVQNSAMSGKQSMYDLFSYQQNTQYSDVEADEFSFNFMGHSGKFYYGGPSQGWRVISDEAIKVVLGDPAQPGNEFFSASEIKTMIDAYSPHATTVGFDASTQSRMFKSFIIITPDGTKYYFGGANAVELTSTYGATLLPGGGSVGSNFYVNTWLLQKVVDVNNFEVDFAYRRSYPTCDLYTLAGDYKYSCYQPGGGFLGSYLGAGASYNMGVPSSYTGQFDWLMYLSSISTPNETVAFNGSVATSLRFPASDYIFNLGGTADGEFVQEVLNSSSANLQWEELDNIIVSDKVPNVFRKFVFTYTKSGIDPSQQRLTLYGLQAQDKNSVPVSTYSFNYDNPNGYTIANLPLYNGNYTDHYGYFNNNNIVGLYVPQAAAQRGTNASLVTTGLLSKISYPTGGSTVFTWEAHDYSQTLNPNRSQLDNATGYAGGSRIAKISNYLSDGTLATEKTYWYKRGYTKANAANAASLTSSGVLNGLPGYVFDMPNRPAMLGNIYSIHKESINPMISYGVNGQGAYLGYDEVAEVNRDGSYTRHFFTSYGPDYNGVTHYDQAPDQMIGWLSGDNYIPYSLLDPERGKLVAQLQYNTSDQVVHKLVNTYRSDPTRFNNYFRLLHQNGAYGAEACTINDALVFATANKVFGYSYYPVQQSVTDYDLTGGNALTTTSQMAYDADNLLTGKTVTNSRGETVVTTYVHTKELLAAEPGNAVAPTMVINNILTPVIETTESNNGTQTNLVHANYYAPSAGIFVPLTLEMKTVAGIREVRQQTYNYNTHGQILEQAKPLAPHDVYVYGYNSVYPVAVISNSTLAQVQQVMTQNGITQAQLDNAVTLTDAQLRTKLNFFRTGLPNSLVTTYSYSPLMGITSMTDPKGKITYYEYDSFGRLRIIRDKDGNIIKQTSYHYKQ